LATPQKSPDSLPELDIDERRERIAAFVHTEHFASVQDLARLFGVSQVTIRNDIDALTQARKDLRRVRGGVMRGQLPYAETPYEARSRANADDKRAIGLAAAAMVQSNETIILDVGTTTMAIAQALVERVDLTSVTIFTNGLNIALALEAAYPRLQTVVTGGSLRPLQHSLVDPMAGLVLERIRAGIAFIGCNGVDVEFGVSTTNLPEATVKQMIMRSALRVIVVADASKFGRATLARICAVDDVDSFLTAGHVDASYARQLRDLGVELVNARPPMT
jgi:DeoR family transcriptional regulator of aga operon